MNEDLLLEIRDLFCCPKCKSSLSWDHSLVVCDDCRTEFPIINGIPRFLADKHADVRIDDNRTLSTVVDNTREVFGYEWAHFANWGFEENVPSDKSDEFFGGTISDRRSAFDTKCRLNEIDLRDKIIIDAGCGNGRYTYEAATRAVGSVVIGVDLGDGSVEAARRNCSEFEHVVIIQASLFELPFKDGAVDCVFSNGVLMHTGDARSAYLEVARTVKAGGVFVAHVYGKLNPVWEFFDFKIRKFTTQKSIHWNLKFAKILSKIARKLNKFPYLLKAVNFFFRLQTTEHHMFDWYTAPVASHHTYAELEAWAQEAGLEVEDDLVNLQNQQNKIFDRPWAINLKARKRN